MYTRKMRSLIQSTGYPPSLITNSNHDSGKTFVTFRDESGVEKGQRRKT